MEQNVKALLGLQLQGTMLELNSLPCRQYKKFAARLPRTCTIVICKSGVRKGNERKDRVQSSPRSAVGCSSAAQTVKEHWFNMSEEIGKLRKSKQGLQEPESSFVELKATIVLCRKEFFDMPMESEGMKDWDLEDEQSGKRVSLQLVSNFADPSKCSSSLLAMD